MDFNISIERPEGDPNSGPITVGWFLTSDKGAVLYDPPERVSFRQTNKTHSKSAARCPGVIQLESRYFMTNAPSTSISALAGMTKARRCLSIVPAQPAPSGATSWAR